MSYRDTILLYTIYRVMLYIDKSDTTMAPTRAQETPICQKKVSKGDDQRHKTWNLRWGKWRSLQGGGKLVWFRSSLEVLGIS